MQECRVLGVTLTLHRNFGSDEKKWLELACFAHNPDKLVIFYRREPLRECFFVREIGRNVYKRGPVKEGSAGRTERQGSGGF
jgi:predicted TIM-barrel fold metal-dependent hydrolase